MVISAAARAAAKILARKAYMKAYRQRLEVKTAARVRQSKPEYKAIVKAWKQIPENKVKAKAKVYRERPYVKAKQRARKQKPENKAKERIQRVLLARSDTRVWTPERSAHYKEYMKRPEVQARVNYLRTPEVSTKRKVARQKLGFDLHLNLKLIDLKTGTLKEKLTRKERKKLGYAGNFFAPSIAVGGLGAYVVSERGKK